MGRPVPPDPARWNTRALEEILLYLEFTPGDPALHAANHTALMNRVTGYGVPLTEVDRQTLRRFHDEFASAGLGLRYTSLGGRPAGYPSQRDLYTATDLTGQQVSYLSTEERFLVVRESGAAEPDRAGGGGSFGTHGDEGDRRLPQGDRPHRLGLLCVQCRDVPVPPG
jgi:hypothetical protein